MAQLSKGSVRAVSEPSKGSMVASVELPVTLERAFRALASKEVIDWWVRPGVFDTREWSGDVRTGGRWQSSGIGAGGRPYTLDGEFLTVDPSRKLVHTWHIAGTPAAPTTVSYVLDKTATGTRITLEHKGFTTAEGLESTRIGWETSFTRLAEILPPS